MDIREIKRVGMIGLGKMGRPMVRHLVNKGFSVTGFDVNQEAVKAAGALAGR